MSGLETRRVGEPKGFESALALAIMISVPVLTLAVSLGHSRDMQADARLAQRHVEIVAARHIADAAMQLTIGELLSSSAAVGLPADGRLRAMRVGNRDVLISVRRASGLVDINSASAGVLRAVFIAAGADEHLADRLAARVLDWRDADGSTLPLGAEDPDYRSSGLPWTARDASFSSVEELRYVLGMPPQIYHALSPYLTVHSGGEGVELDVAPPFLVAALELADVGVARPRMRVLSRGGNGLFHINVGVPGPAGIFGSAEAVVLIERDAEQPYTVLSWREVSTLLTESREASRT